MRFIDRTGEINYNTFGSEMKIVRYRNDRDIDVLFPKYNWVFKNARYGNFKNKGIKCPYEPRVCGKGFIGEGFYTPKDNKKIYIKWQSMLERCYDEKFQKKNPTYEGCKVCEEWLNFQNFAKWYEENYYEIKGEQIHLDKDILIKGNKTYSPENCIFAPIKINSLFTKREECRGKYPIGVKPNGKGYSSRCRNAYGKEVSLGNFNTPHEAFLIYKLNKELVIQSVAQKYKKLIPNRLYEALINYKVEEDD